MTDDNTHNGQSDSPAVDHRPEGPDDSEGQDARPEGLQATLGFQDGITFILAVFLFAVIPAWMVGRKRGPRG